MLIEPMYHAIFYDVTKPMDVYNAMQLRIDRQKFVNLTDDIIKKQVELKCDDKWARYNVISVKTFCVVNSIDNTYFIVCEVEKEIDFSSVFKPAKWEK